MPDMRRRLADLERRAVRFDDPPAYVSLTHEEWAAFTSGDPLVAGPIEQRINGATKIYIGFSPDDWDTPQGD